MRSKLPGLFSSRPFAARGPAVMSLDKSLRRKSRLVRARNVYSREERILRLQAIERWEEGQSPIGLPKVRIVRTVSGRKKKKKSKDEDD